MSKEKDKKKSPFYGKPWATHSKHQEYLSASTAKEKLLTEEGLQVKIRRYSDETFHVKTRSTVVKVVKPTKIVKPKNEEQKQTKTRARDDRPKTRAQRRAEKMRRKARQEKK